MLFKSLKQLHQYLATKLYIIVEILFEEKYIAKLLSIYKERSIKQLLLILFIVNSKRRDTQD